MILPPLTFDEATCLDPDRLSQRPLALAGGKIVASPVGRRVALPGYLIAPGIVDLHGDGFERHLAPRRGAQGDIGEGLRALDVELAANGITTAVLAQFFSWEGGMRGPDFAEAVAETLAAGLDVFADLRLQLRLEINLLDAYPRALALIERAGIGYVVFNDHLPHDALAAGKRPPRLTGQALKSGRSPEAHLAFLHALHARRGEVPAALAKLASTLAARGVLMGSHDDPDARTRTAMRAIGAHICEFPTTAQAAQAAHEAGDPVLMGAPNVVRGGSHDGGISARDLIAEGTVDALVSDYHYPSLPRAAFALAATPEDLPAAWARISAAPATILGLEDRGDLSPGKRADLVILEAATGRVAGTLTGGKAAYLSGDLAARLIGAGAA